VINRWMFQEKYELTGASNCRRLATDRHARAGARVLSRSRTRAASRTRRSTSSTPTVGYELAGHVGRARGRFAITTRLLRAPAARRDLARGLEREIARAAPSRPRRREPAADAAYLEQMNGSVALGFSGDDQLLARSCCATSVCAKPTPPRDRAVPRIATTIGSPANSQVYERIERARPPAALGQMAAGLAHEIATRSDRSRARRSCCSRAHIHARQNTREFLDIIVEEVNRLKQDLSQFLDYAPVPRRARRSRQEVVRKTLQLSPRRGGPQRRDREQLRRRAAARARRRRAAFAVF